MVVAARRVVVAAAQAARVVAQFVRCALDIASDALQEPLHSIGTAGDGFPLRSMHALSNL